MCTLIRVYVIGSNYNCTNGMEINVEMLCDGTDDCGDNSDENGMLCLGMWPKCLISVHIL